MRTRTLNSSNPSVATPRFGVPRLRPVCHAIAMLVAAGAALPVHAAANLANLGGQASAARAAGLMGGSAGLGTANLGVNAQQARQASQVSIQNLTHAAQAVAQQMAAQQAAAAAAAVASTVPNGLAVGGLQVARGAAPTGSSDPSNPALWLNAQLPTQSVASNGHVNVNVQQTAQKAVVSWQTMNVGAQTTLNFDQSGGAQADGTNNWVVLNRIMDPSTAPSRILGNITAQGSVYVINRNGVIFGGASQVNVNSLLVSSLNLFDNNLANSNTRFLTGGLGDLNTTNVATHSILLTSAAPGAGDITLEPGATVTLGNQGLGLIAAPNVTNGGTLTAPGGQVALIAGVGVSYDYNSSSLSPYGFNAGPEGTNDNSTTVLRFANYGKLVDGNGNDITPLGTLTNDGLIDTPRGNITLLGGAVAQNGTVVATTSVAQPGSIVISGQYEVGVNPGSLTPADEYDQYFYTGAVRFGPQSVTAILPDDNGVTLPSDATSLAPFQKVATGASFTAPLPTQGPGLIEISGQAIDFQGGSLTYAPGQTIAANAVVLADPRASVGALPDAGRILLESGATLDVSGIPDTELPMASNLLTVTLAGNELADDPLQRNGFLNDASVTVDMGTSGVNPETGEPWVGTPLANLANYANLVQRPMGQLLVNGGAIDLSANEVVGAPGSTLNLMGGYLDYQSGTVRTTNLLDQNGLIVAIGKADPNDVYVGLAGQFVESHPHWGVTTVWSNPLLNQGVMEGEYIVGGNAGTLNISITGGAIGAPPVPDSGAIVLDSTVLAGDVAGARQVQSNQLPSGGNFMFEGLLPIEIAASGSADAALLPTGFTVATPLLATPGSVYASADVFDSQVLDKAGFSSITLTSGGSLQGLPYDAITEDAGATLSVQPGGSITLVGANTTINGALTARGGAINITGNAHVTSDNADAVAGDITIGTGAVLDVSGFFINGHNTASDQPSPPLPINAGSIALSTNTGVSPLNPFGGLPAADAIDVTGNITLAPGSLLDLQGGGQILSNGKLATDGKGVPLGQGGSLSLRTYAGIQAPLTAAAPVPARGVLTLDGSIDALGFNGGGMLTLEQGRLQIGGDAAATPADTFYFDPSYWGNLGFASFALSAVTGATVPAGATVLLQHQNLLPEASILSAPSGADTRGYATVGLLADALRSPTNLSVAAAQEMSQDSFNLASGDDSFLLGQGAQIIGDPGAAITLSSYMATTVLGTIRAPGGSISLSMNAGFNYQGPAYPLYIGPDSLLDVSGTVVINPLAAPVHTSAGLVTPLTGTVFPGGTISISDDVTPILMAPGAVLNVSGAAGAFDVAQLVPGGPLGAGQVVLNREPEWSNAGQISIAGATGMLLEGTLLGQAGAPQAAGGTLSVTSDALAAGGASNLILVADAVQALQAAGSQFDFSTYVPGVEGGNSRQALAPTVPAGAMLFGVDILNGSGFDNLVLTATSGAIGFTGQVTATLRNSVTFNTNGFIAANQGNYAWGFYGPNSLPGGATPTTEGAALTVNAPYIAVNGTSANSGGFPIIIGRASADADLTLNADQIDLSAFSFLQNIGQATYNSTGDIRLLPAQVLEGSAMAGYLDSAGDLTFNAGEIYPATGTAFILESRGQNGTITFGYPDGGTAASGTPLSAGGTLLVTASDIEQDGKLQAPFGHIILGVPSGETVASLLGFSIGVSQPVTTQTVTLGAGSITSVAADNAVIPYGTTVDQTTWIYNPAANNPGWSGATAAAAAPLPLSAAPQGVVTLNGVSLAFNPGAVVDVSGGGDLQAQEWIPGTGGARDVLSQYNTSYASSKTGTQVPLYADARQVYAIVPGYSGKIAPYDAALNQAGIAPGQQIYLAGGPGLAAGYYTLLPAKYATQPGAFRVVVNSGVLNPLTNQTQVLPDGTLDMAGYLANGFNGAHASTVAQFMVQPASTWQMYSQYALTSASSFFPSYAALNGLAAPYVPADAGRLVLAATGDLTLGGTLQGKPGAGGLGGQVDISSQYLEVLGAGETVDPGYLGISASALDTLGADSLLLGGTRQMTDVGTVITPTANGIIIANDAADPLTGQQILLVAAPLFHTGSIVLDNEGDTTTVQLPTAGTGLVTLRGGSVIQATGSGADVGGQTLVLGNALQTLAQLPSSVVASTGAGAVTIQSYYAVLDSALGTLLQVSSGAPGTLQLPSAAQLDPGAITVQDNLGSNPNFSIALPSLAALAGGIAVEAGAQINGGNVLTLATTGDSQVQSGAQLSGNNISAISSRITFVGTGAAAAGASGDLGGMTIDASLLNQLEQSSNVNLQSYGAIDFQGDVQIAMAGNAGTLTLGADSLASDGGQVAISAATLVLDNTLGGVASSATSGNGTLSVDANQLIFAAGAKSLSGFSAATLTAHQSIDGQGSGGIDFGAMPVTLQTPTMIADTSSSQTLTTTGALSVVAGGSATPAASTELGGALTLQGGSVSVAVPVQAQGGNITLQSSAGDITLTGTAALLAHGVAKQFGATTEYASGGLITLAANQGTVAIQPGAVLDFAGAANGGDGGSLSISTTGSDTPVSFGGTLSGASAAGYTGSRFGLNSAGATDLDTLAKTLGAAGVTGSIVVQTGQGDLSLSSNLNASRVSLTADAGMVDVSGAITAHGAATTAGEIDLYGAAGVAVDGTLSATGSPNSQKPGGLINLGTTGTGSTTALNASYGYENVDPAASGTITLGPRAVLDANGGTVTLRAPILDAQNAQGSNLNVVLAPGAQIRGGAVLLDAYAVWSTADQSSNANQHFDGIVDPAGWYGSSGTLLAGSFTDIKGNPVATWDGTTLVNQDGTSNNLSFYLTNDYFAPTVANENHAIFYGGYDLTGTFDPANPTAGSLPAFVQQPGIQLGSSLAALANFAARPEIDLVNPGSAAGGVDDGNINVLTNWNLGAGVLNADGSRTLAYRYQGTIAPVVSLRAAGNVALDASISDGFFQTANVVLPAGAPPTTTGPATYEGAEASYNALAGGPSDYSSLTQIGLFDGTSQLLGTLDPNVVLAAPQADGSTDYYQDYQDYISKLYAPWATDFPSNNGFFLPITPVTQGVPIEPVAPAMSDPQYAQDYTAYLSAYNAWLLSNFTTATMHASGTPPAPSAPLNTAQYPDYVSADAGYISYAFSALYDGDSAYIFAPVAPALITGSTGTPPPTGLPSNANAPSNMGNASDPLPLQFAALVAGQSASYRIVAGAATASANPLALQSGLNGAAGQGDVVLDGHLALLQLNGTNAEIVAPTTLRTGTGSIEIAAGGNVELLDELAPGVVYTAGTPLQPTANDDASTIGLSQGAYNYTTGAGTGAPGKGVDTILTPTVNAADAGDITLTVLGDIIGFQKVTDTLATGFAGGTFNASPASGLSSDPGAFLGQYWMPWLLTNPADPSVPWYVNFGSFDQGIMSLGGNVTVQAGGAIHDLGVSLPTTSYLDSANALHVTGGGNLSVTAGGSIYSGDFYVGLGAGSIKAGGAIASDFTFEGSALSFPVQTVLAVQYGTIDVQARESADIGGVYDPTYLMSGSAAVASYKTAFDPAVVKYVPYVTSMGTDSGVSIQSSGGDLTFNSLVEQAALFDLAQGGTGVGTEIIDPAASVSSLLLPASLNLVALDGGINIEHGGGLYPSASGTLTIVADQSINLAIPILFGRDQYGNTATQLVQGPQSGNISYASLGKLDYLVGTGLLPTGANPTLVDGSQLTPTQERDPALVAANASAAVQIYSLNGSLLDGTAVPQAVTSGGATFSVIGGVGATVGQISLVPNAPAQIYAGVDILNLPFFGENYDAADITSVLAGRDIRYDPLGNGQAATIELAGPGTLDVEAGRNIDFQTQRGAVAVQTGIRTIGNSIDAAANPGTGTVDVGFVPHTFLSDYGNPYLPRGGASVNVLFGVGPGIDQAAFISQYINPAAALASSVGSGTQLVSFVDQYDTASGNAAAAPQTVEQAWTQFQALPANQQQLLVQQVFLTILDTTGKDYNDAASLYYHQYERGYAAINTLFPASLGYTENGLSGGTNGANRLQSTGDFDMRGSTVQTQQGGDISLFGPGGRVLVGSSTASPAINPASEGILTLEQGSIDTFTDADVLVAQSRVMTEQGGDILMWSSNGNLDAGKGAKTSVSAPPPDYACDIDFICGVDIKGVVSGAGIATLQSLPGVPVGDADLVAPRGTVDAGAAGIRVSGNLNIAALHVANVDNIQVQGKTTGIPTVQSVDTSALTAASSTTSAVTQMAQNLVRQNAHGVISRHWVITVQVEGFGDSNDDENRKKRRPVPVSYSPSSEVSVLGFGGVGETQRAYLTKEEQSQLGGL